LHAALAPGLSGARLPLEGGVLLVLAPAENILRDPIPEGRYAAFTGRFATWRFSERAAPYLAFITRQTQPRKCLLDWRNVAETPVACHA